MLLQPGASVDGARSFFGDLLQTICYLGYADVLEVLTQAENVILDWDVKTAYGEDLLCLARKGFWHPYERTSDRVR